MNKRMLVITGVVLVAVVGVAVIGFIVANDKSKVGNPGAYYGQDADGFSANVNPNEHLGTVKVVSVDAVKSGFGNEVTVESAKESGTVNLGATKSETATYTVKSPRGDVTFEVDVRTYATAGDLKKSNPFIGAEQAAVEGLPNEAHYLIPYGQEMLNEQQVALLTTSGKTAYKFAIVQPTDKILYSVEEAKPILLEIAKQAKLSEIK